MSCLQFAATERLERAIDSIQNTIEEQGGAVIIKMKVSRSAVCVLACTDMIDKPKAVSETDEQDLAQLMAKAGRENAEVSGDEDDEEAL